MNYAYHVKKLRRQFKDFVYKWNDNLMDKFHPGQHIILKDCAHIAERSYERGVDVAVVIRLVSYMLEYHMDKLRTTGDIGIAYADRLGLILTCSHSKGEWQDKTEIRINTVINGTKLNADRIIPISFNSMMSYNLPNVVKVVYNPVVFNFDKQFEEARIRIHNFIDAR